ncbi:MAG: hypothetical protein UV01_C0009G0030 [Parcubacteria group bacterium GW2011_GWA2_42_14]|nr:MAG: hypothetical protein UV01_C0009G0030 [Parcubacteria group bacterium GW2011_GWA2_42_14]
MKHDKMHMSCCLMPLAGIILWLASSAALILAWLSGNGFMLGRNSVQWYWDALILGVLAVGSKLGVIIKRGSELKCEKHEKDK